ncbi:MAG: alpha/beta hydrolase [Planctomycetaceae bacterium]|jgi:pimeloyl-ACP methyl ester carboxylesterase|nr:alpha/beta hydrolase [Planctomycetaceae bacterium]
MSFYSLGGTSSANFYVRQRGGGKPVLFIHGYPFDSSMWEPLFPFFPDSYRLIAPDLRGLGKSPLPQNTGLTNASISTMEMFADDMAALLDAMDVKEPVTFCGLSMGGYIAMHFAAKYPDRLSALILCGTKTAADLPNAAENRRKQAAGLRAGTMTLGNVADAMLPKLLSPATQSGNLPVVNAVRSMIESNNPQGAAAATLGMAQRTDTTEVLRQLNVPVAAIGGRDDLFVPPGEMQTLADTAKCGTFTEIADAGHLPPVEQPQQFAKAVTVLLGKVTG